MISDDKIIKGNILIARFHGLYFRNDQPNKYPDGYFINNELKNQEIIEQREIMKVGSSFDYHCTWASLIDSWFKFQTKYDRTIQSYKLANTSFWKEFVAGIYNADIEQSWKGLAKGAHWYLGSYYL